MKTNHSKHNNAEKIKEYYTRYLHFLLFISYSCIFVIFWQSKLLEVLLFNDQRYKRAVKNQEDSGIILRISDEIRITPVLVSKFVMEAYLIEQQELKMKEMEELQNTETDEVKEGTAAESKFFMIKV